MDINYAAATLKSGMGSIAVHEEIRLPSARELSDIFEKSLRRYDKRLELY